MVGSRRRILRLPGSDVPGADAIARLQKLAWIISHDADGNPLPPEPLRELRTPAPPPIDPHDPRLEHMWAVIRRAGERDRRRQAKSAARAAAQLAAPPQMELFQ